MKKRNVRMSKGCCGAKINAKHRPSCRRMAKLKLKQLGLNKYKIRGAPIKPATPSKIPGTYIFDPIGRHFITGTDEIDTITTWLTILTFGFILLLGAVVVIIIL